MKKNSFIILLITLFIFSCSSKRAFYTPYVKEPKNILPEVDKKKEGKIKYNEYKKQLKAMNAEWDLYEKIRDNLSKSEYVKLDNNLELLKNLHSQNSAVFKYEDYYNGAIYYSSVSLVKQYKFPEAVKNFGKIPAQSYFYNLSLDWINKLTTDSDQDEYNDAWEIMEGYNQMNPYSHP